jgi:hypothetical protein
MISNKVREEGFQLQLKLTQEIEELRKQTESVAAEADRQAFLLRCFDNMKVNQLACMSNEDCSRGSHLRWSLT